MDMYGVDDEDPRQGINNPAERAQMRAQLVLLLHAQKCGTRATVEQQDNNCALPYCSAMKKLLQHHRTCRPSIVPCDEPLCSSSGELLDHWMKCNNENCQLCIPLKLSTLKDWQHSITEVQRKHLVNLLYSTGALFCADRIENDIYDKANSLEDYYRMAAAKKWESEMSLSAQRLRPKRTHFLNSELSSRVLGLIIAGNGRLLF